jgi:hypothetical protein
VLVTSPRHRMGHARDEFVLFHCRLFIPQVFLFRKQDIFDWNR